MSLSTNNKQKSLPSSPISTDYVHLSTNDYSKLDFPKVKSSQILKEGGERYFTLILSNNIEIQRTLPQFNTLHAYLSYRYPKSKLPAEVPYRSWTNYIGSITETINNNYVPESVHNMYNNATSTFITNNNNNEQDTDNNNNNPNNNNVSNNTTTDNGDKNDNNQNKEEEYIAYIEAAISSYIASLFSIPEAWNCKKTIEFFKPGEYNAISNNEMTLKESSRQLISAETFLLQAVPRSMVELASQGVFELDIRVKTKRDIIIWDFSVLEHDIAFTVYFEDENNNTTIIHQQQGGSGKNNDNNSDDKTNNNNNGNNNNTKNIMEKKKVKKRKPRLSFFQSSSWGTSKKTNIPASSSSDTNNNNTNNTNNKEDKNDEKNKSIQDIVDEKCAATDKSTWLQVYPYTHYTTDECCPPLSVQGRFHPGRSGTCRLEWDNSFSMIRSKTLRYVVEVVSTEAVAAASLAADDKANLDERLKREKIHADEVNEAMNTGAGTSFNNNNNNNFSNQINNNNNGSTNKVPTHLSSESVLIERLEKMEDVLAKMTAKRDQALAKAQMEETQRKENDTILMETQRRLEELEGIVKKQKVEMNDIIEKCDKWETVAKTEIGNGEEHLAQLEEMKVKFDTIEKERIRLLRLNKDLHGELDKVNGVELINENEAMKSELKDLKKEMKRQSGMLEDEKHESETKNSEIVQLKASVEMLKSEMRSQKAIVDGDILKYKSTNQKLMDEIEIYKGKESKLKAQKTVLVREVKSLRNKLNTMNNSQSPLRNRKGNGDGNGDGKDNNMKKTSSSDDNNNNNTSSNEIEVRGW